MFDVVVISQQATDQIGFIVIRAGDQQICGIYACRFQDWQGGPVSQNTGNVQTTLYHFQLIGAFIDHSDFKVVFGEFGGDVKTCFSRTDN